MWLDMSGTSAWPAVCTGRLAMDQQGADELELRQFV